MNKKIVSAAVSALLLALPTAVLATSFNPGPVPAADTNLDVITIIELLFGILWPIAVAFFIVMFVIAAFAFFNARGEPEKLAGARNFVIFGIVGVIVALLAWSLPFIIRNMFPGI